MFIDLDHFKEVNDTLGHDVGDALLIESAKRIKQCVREVDSVARLGGDEFIVILTGVENGAGIDRVAQQIMQQLSLPFSLAQQVVHISASIGISLYPDDGLNIESLMKNSDQAMYRSKAQGRNCYQYFTQSMLATAQARMALIHDFHNALVNHEFVIHYSLSTHSQP